MILQRVTSTSEFLQEVTSDFYKKEFLQRVTSDFITTNEQRVNLQRATNKEWKVTSQN